MYLCLCAGVSEEKAIKVLRSARSLEELQMLTGAGVRCSACIPRLLELLQNRIDELKENDAPKVR